MGIKKKALEEADGLKTNHENSGSGGVHGLGAQHELTRIPDPEDISGDGPRAEHHEPLMRVHSNRGGGRTDGLAATHHTTRIHDAADVEPEIMDHDR